MTETCGNCINCEKYIHKGEEAWSCENAAGQVGMPVNVKPPYDEACSNWSDNPKDKGKAERELRHYVDNFWNRG